MDRGSKKGVDCLSFLFFTSWRFIYICMQAGSWIDVYIGYLRSSCRYESQVERSHIWNTDLLCQKWHMRNQEIGMIISLADPDIYYCDIEQCSMIEYHVANLMIGEFAILTCTSPHQFRQKKSC